MSGQEACSQYEAHPLRKICKTCRGLREDHPLSEEDVETIKQNLNVFADQPKSVPNVQYAWTPPNCPTNRVDEYFQKFPQDKVPRHDSEGQKNRVKRLVYQIPLSDLSLEHCQFVESSSKPEIEKYIENLQTTVLRIGEVKEWSEGMAVQCPKCFLILEPDELVITTAENGSQAFHPACFVCFQCQDFLADLIYCSDIDGTVFCLRHFNDNNKKRCHTCDELIFSTHYALGGEKFYHKDHLLCFGCDKLLEGNKGLEKEGELYCSPCYEELFCSDCIKCQKRITVESRHIAYLDRNWHYDCFTCVKCDAPLADSPFEIVKEEFLCTECYNKEHAPKCGGCEEVFDLHAKVVKYEDKIYHVPCFKCADCEDGIGTGSFVPHEGRVYCKACHRRNFGVKCFRCTYSITDEHGIMYDKRPYHEECFTCHQCSTKIANRPFKNVEGKRYCVNCYAVTFCKKCHSCDKPILLGADEDILYSFEDYRWHAGCFICSDCGKSLAGNPFTIREKTLVCKACVAKNLATSSTSQDQIVEQTEEQDGSGTVSS